MVQDSGSQLSGPVDWMSGELYPTRRSGLDPVWDQSLGLVWYADQDPRYFNMMPQSCMH